MDGVTHTGGAYLDPLADLTWKLVGTGDFTAEWEAGPPVEEHVDRGERRVVHERHDAHGGAYLATLADLNWKIAMVADFNGDGKPDIFWRTARRGETGSGT